MFSAYPPVFFLRKKLNMGMKHVNFFILHLLLTFVVDISSDLWALLSFEAFPLPIYPSLSVSQRLMFFLLLPVPNVNTSET